jgi:hypothetical protein
MDDEPPCGLACIVISSLTQFVSGQFSLWSLSHRGSHETGCALALGEFHFYSAVTPMANLIAAFVDWLELAVTRRG